MCDFINMIGKKLLKSFKKKSSLIFFCITLLYLFYTYVSLFLFIFNNALFYLFVNILLFYVCFHFVVRALTYPGSLFIYQNKTNYDNRIEFSKFYLRETSKLSAVLKDIHTIVKEKIRNEKKDKENTYKIKLEELFSYNNKENYYNFFSSLYILYTLYVTYYLYINLEENVDLNEEQLNFYYHLKYFMIKINEIYIHVNKNDIICPDIFTKINIGKDFNETVNEFITSKGDIYQKEPYQILKYEGIQNYIKKISGIINTMVNDVHKNIFNMYNNTSLDEKKNLRNSNSKNIKMCNEINIKNKTGEDLKDHFDYFNGKNESNIDEKSKIIDRDNSNNNIKSMDNLPSNKNMSAYAEINILTLFYHENYEKSISHANYKDFYILIEDDKFLKLLNKLIHLINILGDIFRKNSLKDKMNIGNIQSFIKNQIVGTLDLFKYEMIYKYYAKQEYLYMNRNKLDCMFIPCKKFLNSKMEKYYENLRTNPDQLFHLDMSNDNNNNNKYNNNKYNRYNIFFRAFNNQFYNYIYHEDYLRDVPVVLYFNPNGAYYELNACYGGTLQFYLQNNINVFVYNYRGYGKSCGYPNFNRNNMDALKIAEYLLSKDVKYLGLHGTSIGGPLCSYVSYHLSNFNKKSNGTYEMIDKIYKNEIDIRRIKKEIYKLILLMNRKKTKLIDHLLVPIKYILWLLLQFLTLCKLKISNYRMKKIWNINNIENNKLLNKKDVNYNTGQEEKSKISFVCIDRSFYNFEQVARYMIGEYAYNILKFTSYKLDITKYYINSNVPKILIYDNYDEIIHYMSNAITGVSREISKVYKNGNLYMESSRKKSNEQKALNHEYMKEDQIVNMNLLPLLIDDDDKKCGVHMGKEVIENMDTSFDQTLNNNNNKNNNNNNNNNDKKEKRNNNIIHNNNNNYDDFIVNRDLPTFADTLIIDEYVDNYWSENKLKNIDFRLFLQSWKVLNDCISFLNKCSTTNNSFISIGLETYKSIMSLYNSKEDKLEEQTHNAIYCIYNDNVSFMDTFKKTSSNYDDYIKEHMNNNLFKKTCIYDMLKENKEFTYEMELLNKILRDVYMSKRKDIEKVHFTYSGFFLKNDYLYDHINKDNRNNDKESLFRIEDIDVIKFLDEFSDSLYETVDSIKYNLNSCGQLFNEINNIPEKEQIDFLKAFIFKMKVYGSYPSQCFTSSKKIEFANRLYEIPFLLSQYCDLHRNINEQTNEDMTNNKMDEEEDTKTCNNDKGCDKKITSSSKNLFTKLKSRTGIGLSSKIDNDEDLTRSFNNNNEGMRTKKIKGKGNIQFEIASTDECCFNENIITIPYFKIKKCLFLHDLIVCMNYYKKDTNKNKFDIFYKFDDITYIIDMKQMVSFFNSYKDDITRQSNYFLSIFSKDIGIDINDLKFSGELEKYVSWMRLNNRMNICKIYFTLKNEIKKMKKYSEKLHSEYSTISQDTNIHFIIFLIYRILIFKKLFTHTYIIYTFIQRLNNSLDINLDEDDKDIDIKSLIPISYFRIYYKDNYKIYSPNALGWPVLVKCGHNGNLNKDEQNFLRLCLDSILKKHI
ncbi:conserved Plasmodium protein, unknown function [Plasmodium sp. DRC-Itaito]|nr:conserved Plasmodium protein, unknown function [Plasmodium sp. DRC-Itaito]